MKVMKPLKSHMRNKNEQILLTRSLGYPMTIFSTNEIQTFFIRSFDEIAKCRNKRP